MSEKRKDNKGRVLRNGEVQRSDGKYMFRYSDSDGKRHTVYSWKLVDTDRVPDGKRCTMSLRSIEKQILKDIDDEIRTAEADATLLNDLFRVFMNVRTDLRESTRCNYAALYDKHVRDVIGYKKIKSIRYTDIQKLYIDLSQAGLSASTIEKINSILYQVFDNAVRDYMIRTNPVRNAFQSIRKISDLKRNKKHALSTEQQSRLIDYIYKSSNYRRFGPLFTVLLGTGMRIGEALGLRWCDCDFTKNIISVNHALQYKESEDGSGYRYRISATKTVAGNRTIPMFSDVKSALLVEMAKPKHPEHKPFIVDGYTDFVFLNNNGKAFTHGHIFDIIQRIVFSYNKEEAVLSINEGREPCFLPKFSSHNLRHTFCTRLCENESNIKVIQDVMGHQNVTTTLDVYTDATEAKKMESFRELDGKIVIA